MDLGALLHERFRIEHALGQRRLAFTYLAVDERTGKRCVVKELSVRRAYESATADVGTVSGSDSDKLIELFERESKVLGHLDHPRVPKLIDHFAITSEDDTSLFLVQQHVDATSLRDLVDVGRHFTEREVASLALDILDVLEYLHGHSPPLIHRDIKPSNILYEDVDGAYLIDFGAVKDRLARHGLEGSTVVGTFDYMPLEQYQGNAVPATDIYSLGVTLIAALSHLDPSDIPRHDDRLDFEVYVQVSPRFRDILAKMVEPSLQRRYRWAADVSADLQAFLTRKGAVPHARVLVTRGKLAVAAAGVTIGATGLYFASHLSSAPADDWGRPMHVREIESSRPPANDPVRPVVAENGVLRVDIYRDFKYEDSGWPMGFRSLKPRRAEWMTNHMSNSEPNRVTAPLDHNTAICRWVTRRTHASRSSSMSGSAQLGSCTWTETTTRT